MIIDLLTPGDVHSAMRLVEIAGWNQTSADWHRILGYEPFGCFKAMVDDRLAGTVTTTSYENRIAWIGMMLVDPDYRRQGIGSALMQKAIDYLNSKSIECIWLDATPMGQPVYQRLGFQALYSFHRWHSSRGVFCKEIKKNFNSVNRSISLQLSHQGLDLRHFGYDRLDYLGRLLKCSDAAISQTGFGMIRQGRIAHYLGPLVTSDVNDAIEIASSLVVIAENDIFLDYPGGDPQFIKWLYENHFSPVRTLTRMWLGKQPDVKAFQMQFAICDPATG